MTAPKIAVLLPCYNEEVAIAQVVKSFHKALPKAQIYVYDNNSTDKTVEKAKAAGAIVRSEVRQGKGHVVRRMFADVEADIYVMADGDETYDATVAPALIQTLIDNNLDMVVGIRDGGDGAYPVGHQFGNWLFNFMLRLLFNSTFKDIFSGYRIFSRRFVKSFPAMSGGFDIETELSVHALELNLPVEEIATVYKERPAGSVSKLNTIRDGIAVAWRMGMLYKAVRPLSFFTWIFAALTLTALVIGYPILEEFLRTGLVPRLPSAILATGIMILAFLSLACGFIVDAVSAARRELKRLQYLAQKSINI
jgi:glycosyltransferase involved in cell wall biosynthesis